MRVLLYGTKGEYDDQKLENIIKNDIIGEFDFTDNLDEALYCMEVRFYDAIFLENNLRLLKNKNTIKKHIENSQTNPSFYIIEKDGLENPKEYKTINKNLLESTIKNIAEIRMKKAFCLKYCPNKFKIDLIYEDTKKITIDLSQEYPFKVLLFMLRHADEKVNLEAILNATTEDPEYERFAKAENAIAEIRNFFKKKMKINPIANHKKIGYRFKLPEIINLLNTSVEA